MSGGPPPLPTGEETKGPHRPWKVGAPPTSLLMPLATTAAVARNAGRVILGFPVALLLQHGWLMPCYDRSSDRLFSKSHGAMSRAGRHHAETSAR